MPNPIGTRIITLRCKAIANPSFQAAVSPILPYPAVITHLQYGTNSAGGDTAIGFFDLFLADDDSTSTDQVTGTKLTAHELAGTSPPDFLASAAEALPTFAAAGESIFPSFPVYIPVPGAGTRLKILIHKLAGAAMAVSVMAVCVMYDAPLVDASEKVIPRGTPEEPVCVRICEPKEPSVGPPLPPPPVAPPPPPPAGPDVLAEPLPSPCTVSVEAPLASFSTSCEAT